MITTILGARLETRDEKGVVKSNQLRRMWHSFCKRRVAVLGLVIVILYAVVAILAPLLAPYDPLEQNLVNMLQTPNLVHPFGTDEVGRDILSRLIYGTRISMQVGLLSVSVSLLIGLPLGIISGYFGGKVDIIIMRCVDVMMAFPTMLLAIMFVSVLGADLNKAIFAVGVSAVPNYARMARGETLTIKENEFFEAARAVGASHLRIIVSHVIINITAPMIVMCTLSFGQAIVTTAGLGFLGIGAQPPTPEWGAMLSNGRQYLLLAPHVTTIPGLAILFLALGLNLLGDGLRDVLDPKMKD